MKNRTYALLDLVLIVALVALTACSSQFELMERSNGDRYVYHLGHVGGQVIGKSSMGTSYAGDQQKSFSDLLQGITAIKGFSAQSKVMMSQEVTKRFEAGQITAQMRDKLNAAITMAQTDAGLKVALAEIAAGQ